MSTPFSRSTTSPSPPAGQSPQGSEGARATPLPPRYPHGSTPGAQVPGHFIRITDVAPTWPLPQPRRVRPAWEPEPQLPALSGAGWAGCSPLRSPLKRGPQQGAEFRLLGLYIRSLTAARAFRHLVRRPGPPGPDIRRALGVLRAAPTHARTQARGAVRALSRARAAASPAASLCPSPRPHAPPLPPARRRNLEPAEQRQEWGSGHHFRPSAL